MQIPTKPATDPSVRDSAAPSSLPAPNKPAAAPAHSNLLPAEQTVSSESSSIVEQAQPNVSFRRDSNGQIYYVLTDAQTGEELREFPPAEIRKVGEGIADYLKQEQEKSAPHIQVKA